MSYRDDREALHQHVAQLEEQLADARREGEAHGRDDAAARAAALEQKLADMRGELEKMSTELAALRGSRPRRPSFFVLLGAAAVLIATAGVVFAFAFALRAPAPRPVASLSAPPSPALPPWPKAPADSTVVVPPARPAPPPEPPRSTTARWNARVTRAEGIALGAGSPCTIEATITAPNGTNAVVQDLVIQCGTQSLYRSTDALEGMSQGWTDPREELGPADDKSTFTMLYRDIGTRSGARAQIDLDTKLRQGAVFRETLPRFRVELSVPPSSVPGEPLAGADDRLRRTGKIVGVTGGAPVKIGATCLLRAMPIGKKQDCVAELACGATVLWPVSAHVSCTYRGSRPVSVETADGPSSLSLEASTLTLKSKPFGAVIALDEL